LRRVCPHVCPNAPKFSDLANTVSEWYVNVKDTARIHVAALLSSSISNERIFAFANTFTWNEVLEVLRNLYPTRNFPGDISGAERSNMKVPNERGAQLLKAFFGRESWTGLEETVADNLRDLV